MNNPKVSILIANYNNEIFISECIDSLKKQTYKNLEVIFFDDFSKDNSINIIKNFKEVKLIQNLEKTIEIFFPSSNKSCILFIFSLSKLSLFKTKWVAPSNG